MKSKKLKIIVTCVAMAFISLGLVTGCGNKASDEPSKEPKTTEREIDGKKVKVIENGKGEAQIEMPD